MHDSLYGKLNRYFDNKKEYGALFLRVIIGWRLIDGSQDNVFSWARMLEFRDFLEQLQVPFPLVSAQLSVYAQFVCGILYIVGWFIRPAALIMIFNFLVALFVVHLGTSFQESFDALMMLFGSCFFLFYGPGKIALENLTRKKAITRN